MKLYLRDSECQEHLLCVTNDKEEINKAISKYLDDNGYKCHYRRIWESNGRIWIDFGSWSESFIIDDANPNEFVGL